MSDVQRIYEQYAPSLYRYALALSRNAAEAEDLVAETFVRLWAGSGEIRQASLHAYLFTIVRNLFLTRRRAAAREVPIEDVVSDGAQSTHDRAAASIELGEARRHLASMAAADRTALLMRGTQGMSYEQIGAALGVSTGAARVRVHRARAQLAKAIGRTARNTI
uniref:Putative RNA-polymerase sigma factor n=1 Tax=uncultured Acidobacteriota bacterium TaxID=171953 RepID=Q7X341_9BACT|nr:putative RNA-polymerase sigma factor [uncultured Acidobacteriota bacterium]